MKIFGTRRKFMWNIVIISGISLALFLFLDFLVAWQFKQSLLTDAIKYSSLIIIVELIIWLWNKNTERALERAEHSEKVLRQKAEELEAIVTERTNELRQAQAEKMSQLYRFAEFGRLSSGVFHDLMNPLAAIAANVSELSDTIHPDLPGLKAHVSRAVTSSQNLQRFVCAVRKQMSVSDCENTFCLNDEIEGVLILHAHKAVKEKVSLHWHASERITTYGNSVKFNHVISNLISNAIDSYDGCSAENRKVSIRLTQKKGEIKLAVRDHGCGIEECLHEKIFDPFFTSKPSHRGMGIGLSNTKKIITQNFKGNIRVKSIENQGSNFTLVFPRTIEPRR
jgi:two-component system C4-dicarboxylate transport sensor histidine kinase DctB